MAFTTAMKNLNGLLPINKPAGMISKDVSRWLVKRLGRLKLGHVGTLDPAASGVLPILIGRATRMQDLLLNMPKSYEFDITFGHETDTLDSDGETVREAAYDHVTEDGLKLAIKGFVGEITQTPPIFSAVKYKGKPLYEYARAQKDDQVPLESLKRQVQVSSFELLSFDGKKGAFRVTCSRGTYVRSLVKDVAENLDSCGTLTRLIRTHAAGIALDDASGLDDIEAALDSIETLLVPMSEIRVGMPRWRAGQKLWADRLRNGQQLAIEAIEFESAVQNETGDVRIGGWARPIMLLDDQGEVFGMGSAKRHESGRIMINMKRGL